MGRHQRPDQAGARPGWQSRPRFGLAPLILAGAIVISYAVIRASGASTLMFVPPPRLPAISGIRPAHAPASPAARTPAAGLGSVPDRGTPSPGADGGGVSVACQFTSGLVCDVNLGGQATPGTPAAAPVTSGAP
ncbi:MAG: hypothetical protein JO242_04015 [Streptosporangiaceae bacterium]|nr:hypothetical protein [Streptosporangiaceae bacterium]